MQVTSGFTGRADTLIGVFEAAFTASESATEGAVIANLVRQIFATTADEDLRVFAAEEDDAVVGAVAFTRLSYPEDAQRVMLLSPMAVTPDRWKTGVGQALIAAALSAFAGDGLDVVITYGDPRYYGQVGFQQITETDARPPLPLSMPHGWLGRRLTDRAKPALKGPSHCVDAFQNAALW